MAVNTIGDFIRGVFPSTINRDGKVFKALLADKDKKDGTVEKVFSDIETERKKWCNSGSVWNQTGEQFAKTMKTISVLNQSTYETEESFKNRNKYVFYRMGSRVHGTVFDIKRIFEDLLNNECYIVNNSMEYSESLFINGNFEDYQETIGWDIDGCEFSKSAAFEGDLGMLLTEYGSNVSQVVSVNANKTYCLHAFCKGSIEIRLSDNNGRVYDIENEKWSDIQTISVKSIHNEKWRNESVVILTDSEVNSIKVEFINSGDSESCIDYVRLFEKGSTSTFSLIVSFTGAYTNATLHVAPNEEGSYDPKNQSYINQTFIYGGGGRSGTGMFSELLDVLKPFGIHASLEILTAN